MWQREWCKLGLQNVFLGRIFVLLFVHWNLKQTFKKLKNAASQPGRRCTALYLSVLLRFNVRWVYLATHLYRQNGCCCAISEETPRLAAACSDVLSNQNRHSLDTCGSHWPITTSLNRIRWLNWVGRPITDPSSSQKWIVQFGACNLIESESIPEAMIPLGFTGKFAQQSVINCWMISSISSHCVQLVLHQVEK